MNLPTHWPVEGRKRVAPIPAPIEAKISDAPHLRVVRPTLFPRSLSLCAVPISSISSVEFIIP